MMRIITAAAAFAAVAALGGVLGLGDAWTVALVLLGLVAFGSLLGGRR